MSRHTTAEHPPDVDPELLNTACTVRASVIDTTQVPVLEHPPPDHPAKVDPESAVAVSVTDVPVAKFSVQSVPQLIPAGALVTVPAPFPGLLMVSVFADETNFAVTLNVSVPAVREQVVAFPALLHTPPHPSNVFPVSGVAVKLIAFPDSILH